MKKNWQKPQLTVHGNVEDLTQAGFGTLKKVKGFISLGKNLSAVLSM